MQRFLYKSPQRIVVGDIDAPVYGEVVGMPVVGAHHVVDAHVDTVVVIGYAGTVGCRHVAVGEGPGEQMVAI